MVEIARLEAQGKTEPSWTRSWHCCARRAAARVQPDARSSAAAVSASRYPEITEMQARAIFEAAASCPEGRHQGHAGDHDSARRPQEGAARPAGRGRAPGRRARCRRSRRCKRQVPGRHDDRGAARRADGRRDRAVEREFFSLRHQRPDADHVSACRATTREVPAGVSGARRSSTKNPFATIDIRRRRPARATSPWNGAADAAGPQARHLRRARRRSRRRSTSSRRSGSTT